LVKNEASKKSTPIKARVLFDYKATASDELTLAVDDIVTILDKNLDDEGWWKVKSIFRRSLILLVLF
jgi:hypothetical protein